ncbi:MAG: SIS domain-containing protein [Anaerolineae bacterium]|nr:SIS domain-containing protein [Anaerolineae bacterium]MDW8072222.1 6-phospho-3-hexuloisomerase [Anaerolineae bacterium]
MNAYEQVRAILAEIDHVLARVDEAQVTRLCEAIQNARYIFIHGLGREGLVIRAFAMRLMHLGLKVAVVGDVTTPPIGPGDLFLASCGPGHLATVQALVEIARRAGGQVIVITAQPESPVAKEADIVLYIPAQTMAEKEMSSSTQVMGSAFEQAMWILLDALVPRLQTVLGQSAEDLRRRHTNLE